jgi:hypothetical protein
MKNGSTLKLAYVDKIEKKAITRMCGVNTFSGNVQLIFVLNVIQIGSSNAENVCRIITFREKSV